MRELGWVILILLLYVLTNEPEGKDITLGDLAYKRLYEVLE